MSCAEYIVRDFSHCCVLKYYKSYHSCWEKKKNRVRGKALCLFWALHFFFLFLYDCVSVSSAALGMGLFCVSAKWSIKWGEQTVSVSAALPQYGSLLISLLFYLHFLLTPLIVSSVSFRLKSELQLHHRTNMFTKCIKRLENVWHVHSCTASSYSYRSSYSLMSLSRTWLHWLIPITVVLFAPYSPVSAQIFIERFIFIRTDYRGSLLWLCLSLTVLKVQLSSIQWHFYTPQQHYKALNRWSSAWALCQSSYSWAASIKMPEGDVFDWGQRDQMAHSVSIQAHFEVAPLTTHGIAVSLLCYHLLCSKVMYCCTECFVFESE